MLGQFRHLQTNIYSNRLKFPEHLRNRMKFLDHKENRERAPVLLQKLAVR